MTLKKSDFPEKIYVESNDKGRDVFFFYFSSRGFSILTNNVESDHDERPDYLTNLQLYPSITERASSILKQILDSNIDSIEKLDPLANQLFEELKRIPELEKYYLEDELIIDNKFSYDRYRFFHEIDFNPQFENQFFTKEYEPFTENDNALFFLYLCSRRRRPADEETLKNMKGVDRKKFESHLKTDTLKARYADYYDPKNTFLATYFDINKGNINSVTCYSMITDNQLKLFFFESNKS